MDEDVLAQFTEITGSSPELGSQYLQLADFNIEHAMQLYFESGGAPLTEAPLPSSSEQFIGHSGTQNRAVTDSDDDIIIDEARSTPRAQQPQELADDDDETIARRLQEEIYSGREDAWDGVRAPMARTTETLVGPDIEFGEDDTHATILDQLRARQSRGSQPGIFNQRDMGSIWHEDAERSRDMLAEATGGASTTSSKSNMLAEMYRPPFEIMSRLSWDAARQDGRDRERWLLVNIQDSSIFDCQVLNRDLWKDHGVRETVREHFIFLQYSKDDPRAAPYLQYYFPGKDVTDNYPNIAIIDPRTGEQVKVWSGPPVIKAADFLMQLHEFLDRYSLKRNVRNPVARRKPEKREKTVDTMTEEEMMDMAVRKSLGEEAEQSGKLEDPDELTRGADDVKGKRRMAHTEDASASEVAASEAEEISPFWSIPNDKPHVEPPADPATTTRIQFRHPTGRVIRRFALSDKVQRIYEWLKTNPPLEDKMGVEFELNALGRNLVDLLDTSIEEAGLKNGTVMIGYLDS